MAFGVVAGDTAGEGIGLGFVAGTFSAGVTGEGVVAAVGLATVGVELAGGSAAQPAANRSEESVRARIALRLIIFGIEVVMMFVPRFQQD